MNIFYFLYFFPITPMFASKETLLNTFPNVVIGRSNCPFCEKAVSLLFHKNISYLYLSVNEVPDILQDIKNEYKHKTVPMVFINKEFVGGFDDLSKTI